MTLAESCPVCREHLGSLRYIVETGVGQHVVDVNKARVIAFTGHVRHRVEPEFIERLLAGFTPVVEAHIHHVAANTPGILGKLFGGYFLLDGTYSALRSLQERTSFHAYILTFDETVACLVDEPATTPIRAIREVQEMLQNNPGAIEADVSLSGELRGENLPQRMETLIRSKLSVEDNARLRLVFHHRGKVLKQKTVEPE